MSGYAVGIDLGTRNSRVAVFRHGKVKVLFNEEGSNVTASCVTFTEDVILTGPESVDKLHIYTNYTVFDVKKLIGQKFNDPKVQKEIQRLRLPYTVIDVLGSPRIKIDFKNGNTKTYSPEEVSAYILHRMKRIAENGLGEDVTTVVVTVPAYFNDTQIQATKDAAIIAGFKFVNIIDEPTAAALAFCHQNQKPYKRNIVVYDFGRDTLDVSVVAVEKGKYEVKSTKGDSHLGGRDIDVRIMDFIRQDFKEKFHRDINDRTGTITRLLNHKCKKAKKKLSGMYETIIELDNLSGAHEDYCVTMSRSDFNFLNKDLFLKTIEILNDCLKESGLKKDEIHEVILVGGSSRIPYVQRLLEDYFGKNKINKEINPYEAVVCGATIHAANLAENMNKVLEQQELKFKQEPTSTEQLRKFNNAMPKPRIIQEKGDQQEQLRKEAGGKLNLLEFNCEYEFRKEFCETEEFERLRQQSKENGRILAEANKVVNMSGYPVGIDLGTTNSCVAVFRHGRVDVIVNEQGSRVTPSWVTFTEDVTLTGPESVDKSHSYTNTTVFEVKRLIGQKFHDHKVQKDIQRFPYTVINDLGSPKIKVDFKNGNTKEYYPEEVSAYILQRMKKIAETGLNQEITTAVVTVPAYFNDAQRQATKDAAIIAGFKFVNVINEPTAAALAFCHQNQKPYRRNIVVYDFGGGTFDVSVVAVEKGKYEVKSTKGDSHLGGTDIDLRMMDFIRQDFNEKFHRDIKDSTGRVTRRLKSRCEESKKKLSGLYEATIELDDLSGIGEDYCVTMARSDFNRLNKDLFLKTIEILNDCLRESGLKKDDIHQVIVVGGSSRIPSVQSLLEEYFGENKINKEVNPDEAVACGAAIHAANLVGNKNEVLDITSLSLGTNIYGDLMSFIIPRNTPIPAKSTKRYQTVMDNQTTMEFPVYQGEREIASENFELGSFSMTDLAEAPAKAVKVEVCYEIDAEGLLHVSALEIDSNNKKVIEVNLKKTGLSEEQIKKSVEEAETNRKTDLKWRKYAEEKSLLQTLLHEVSTYEKKCKAEYKEILLQKHDEIYKWLEKVKIKDLEDIAKKRHELKNLLSKARVGNT